MSGRVLIDGGLVLIGEVWALLNHPGHADQKSHGRRRGLRSDLAKAKTVEEVAAVVARDASAAIGDNVTVDLTGADVEVARQFGEGVLQGVEKYPATPLREVGTYGPGGSDTPNARLANQSPHEQKAQAFALRGGESNGVGGRYQVQSANLPNGNHTRGTAIYLNTKYGPASFAASARTRELEKSGVLTGRGTVALSPREVALHEFGHSIGNHGRPGQPEYEVGQAAKTNAAAAGKTVKDYVSSVSWYASTDDAELAAEVFTDVMVNGKKASPVSKELFEVFETNVRGWEAEVTP